MQWSIVDYINFIVEIINNNNIIINYFQLYSNVAFREQPSLSG